MIQLNFEPTDRINEFINELKTLNFNYTQPERNIRRNPDGPFVKNIDKSEFPIFCKSFINDKLVEKINENLEILFLGFIWNSNNYLFEMERLLLPLYFSFYLGKPVYIFIKPRFFKVDYLNGITKILQDKIPKFNLILSRSNSLDDYYNIICKYSNYKDSENIKKLVIAPINNYNQNCDYMYNNEFLFKMPDLKMTNQYQNYKKSDKLNIILFNGTLWNYKGQIDFLNDIRRELIKKYILLFIGKEYDYKFKECLKIATKKNIKLICIPFIQSKDLYKIVRKCSYQISYCQNKLLDPNPRSITEGLYAGLPFLVSEYVIIPKIIQNNSKIGYMCKVYNKEDLNEKILKLLKLDSSYLENFVKNNLEVNKICNNLVNNILENYRNV